MAPESNREAVCANAKPQAESTRTESGHVARWVGLVRSHSARGFAFARSAPDLTP